MSSSAHFEASLQQAIDGIRVKVTEMAVLDEQALNACLRSLIERNRSLAYSVILRDQYVDELEKELDRLCLEFFVRQQPAASPLRFVFTTIKVNKELERIGDHAEGVARQVLALGELVSLPAQDRYLELGKLAVHMLHDGVQSFLEQDAELARRTMLIEERANTLRNEINEELTSLHNRRQLTTGDLTLLLSVARRLERVTDQAKNICEEVLYLCTGEFINHPGAEAFRVLFVDDDNCGLSQMAEGIANAMQLPRFVFSSAGIAPLPVSPQVVEFMSTKGIDISRHLSKTREQVPNWEHYQVIVSLSDSARSAFPPAPTKTVCLGWPVPRRSTEDANPSGTEDLESAYLFLQHQILDLVEAIRGEPPPSNKSR